VKGARPGSVLVDIVQKPWLLTFFWTASHVLSNYAGGRSNCWHWDIEIREWPGFWFQQL